MTLCLLNNMQTEKTINVLYVDDELNNLESFKANFRRHYHVFTAISAKVAKQILAENDIHVLITDQRMPVTSGTQMLDEVIYEYPHQTRILLTAYAENEAILDAFQRGLIFKYVIKPYNQPELKQLIDNAYEIHSLKLLKETLYKKWINANQKLDLAQKLKRE
jgi:response regulator RpfG family c-di-GMP phosphodiesterase